MVRTRNGPMNAHLGVEGGNLRLEDYEQTHGIFRWSAHALSNRATTEAIVEGHVPQGARL